ncbi:DNA mismatch repair protein MutT [Deinococcus aerolatus]|uniref:DNA mismatch repair protein MutT n=1 Tax=Deinococcus aerolatus TaxID=522487 RepID=A0ABQ2G3S1_9DEIO|nr:NUDIX domain-containing protein [Deinococcus aerolatus]GGL74048.1 DNA mismatch repair protein MutT [Deinococcus aerolatus]
MSILELRKLWGNRPLIAAAVGVLIQDETGRVLLQRRGDDGLWGEPGGALEPGEDFLAGARRELLEETGLVCPDLTLLPLPDGLQSGPELFHRYPNGHEIYIVGMRAHGTLPASALEQAQPDDSGETLELRWFALNDLPPLSNNANRQSLSVLRARLGLPPLPLEPTPPAPPVGNHLMALRNRVGPRPLFAPGANVLVTDGRDRLLLLRHGGTGKWTVPGGSLEPGESFEDCARRELLEETGLRAEALEPLQMFAGPRHRFTYPHGDVVDNVSVLYRAHDVTGPLTPQAGEVLEVGWFGADELPAEEELSGTLIVDNLRVWKGGQGT